MKSSVARTVPRRSPSLSFMARLTRSSFVSRRVTSSRRSRTSATLFPGLELRSLARPIGAISRPFLEGFKSLLHRLGDGHTLDLALELGFLGELDLRGGLLGIVIGSSKRDELLAIHRPRLWRAALWRAVVPLPADVEVVTLHLAVVVSGIHRRAVLVFDAVRLHRPLPDTTTARWSGTTSTSAGS